ncbi:MAG: molybdate ABC transporter substrate-binding protein [Betaproteobacteria bacterium]
MRALAAAFLFLVAGQACAATLTVFAAASLRESLDAVVRAWREQGGAPVRAVYGASSALARQIEAGAPAHAFFSADEAWTAYLQQRGLVQGSPSAILGNELVLVAPAASAVSLRIAPGFALAAALGDRRLALADPRAVPAGRYARASLESLGVWSAVDKRIAPAESVRAALTMVARGEAPLGIVYRTDAQVEPRVRIVDTFPASTHPPIRYVVAPLRAAPPEAEAFIAFARSPAARRIWAQFGFREP